MIVRGRGLAHAQHEFLKLPGRVARQGGIGRAAAGERGRHPVQA